MDDKFISDKLHDLTKELSATIREAVEINGLQVNVSCYPISQIGTREQIYHVECRIYKEVV